MRTKEPYDVIAGWCNGNTRKTSFQFLLLLYSSVAQLLEAATVMGGDSRGANPFGAAIDLNYRSL